MVHNNYPYPDGGNSPGTLAVILISVVTSALVTLGVLWGTDNLTLTVSPTKDNTQVVAKRLTVVPLLNGMTTQTAMYLLRSRKLHMIIRTERPDSSPKGTIIEQEPLPNSELSEEGTVSVIVSSGSMNVTVPNVAGRPLEEAKALIKTAKLKIGEVSETGTGAPGTVTQISPPAGTELKEGTKIAIQVGKAGIEVPALVDKRRPQARKILKELGLKIGSVVWRYNEYKPAYVILSQKPEPGTLVDEKTAIDLVINED